MGKDNWKKHTAAMLRARAASGGIRAFCPEVIGGSLYESDSGEITDGVPAGDFIEAQVTAPPRTEPKRDATTDTSVPKPLAKITTREMFAQWCEAWGPAASADPRNAVHVETTARRLGIDVAEALTAAGFVIGKREEPSAPARDYDPETGEVPPDQEPPAG